MLKIALAASAAVALLTIAPLVIPAKAEGVKMAQGVDVQVGRDRDDYRYDRDRRYNRDREQLASALAESLSAHENTAAW